MHMICIPILVHLYNILRTRTKEGASYKIRIIINISSTYNIYIYLYLYERLKIVVHKLKRSVILYVRRSKNTSIFLLIILHFISIYYHMHIT